MKNQRMFTNVNELHEKDFLEVRSCFSIRAIGLYSCSFVDPLTFPTPYLLGLNELAVC
jgi:hypothetical protein